MNVTAILFSVFLILPQAYATTFSDISDAIYFSENRVLMINDELSTLIEYDLKNQKVQITQEIFSINNEADFEAMATYGDHLYILGSHSLKRKKVKPTNKRSKNLQRLQEIKRDDYRFHIVRLNLNDLDPTQKEVATLENILNSNQVLAPFMQIPSKENGVDLEGMTIDKNGQIYIGFRGPVLRENLTPVLSIHESDLFSSTPNYQILYVNIGSLGIREILKVDDGFLVIGGAVSDLNVPHKIFFWDGKDMLESKDSIAGKTRLLKELPAGLKAEGISLIKETINSYEVLLSFDGEKDGNLSKISIAK